MSKIRKNQIFYGPAGSGKSFNVVLETLRIMGSSLVNPDNNHLYSDEECTKLLDEFDNYKREGLIEVISFHEAYSYIDFIEGSKLDIKDGRELSGYERTFV